MVITVIGGLAGPALTHAQQTGIDRRPSNFEAAISSGAEVNPSGLLRPPSLGSANPPGINPIRPGAIRSDPPASKPRTAPRPALLIGMYVSYGLLQALDAESTIHALQTRKAYEGNPVLSPFASNPAALAASKLALTGGTILGIDRLRKSRRRLAMITMAVVNGGYAYVVLRSYRNFSTR